MGGKLFALSGSIIPTTAAVLLCLLGGGPVSAQERSQTDDPTALEGTVESSVGEKTPTLEEIADELLSEEDQTPDEVVIDGIAAQVGSEIVLLSEVRRLAAPVEEQMRAVGMSEAEILAMRADALERLIEAKLVEGVVRRAQLSADEAEVTQAVAAIAEENGLSLEQLTQSVQSHGLTMEQYRAKLKAEIERTKVVNTFVRSQVRIEPYELRTLYAERYGDQPAGGFEVHLRHLLVGFGEPPMRNRETACAMVADARQRIAGGEVDFTAVAAQLSDANRETGGDIGWILVRDMAPWMKAAVEGLSAGDISETVVTDFGCNLLQVLERREFHPVSFEEASPELERELFEQRMAEEYVNWIEKLRGEVYIERKGIYAEASRLREKAAEARRRKP